MSRALTCLACLARPLAVGVLLLCLPAVAAAAESGASWRSEQPLPPPPPAGVTGSSSPIALGHVGDVEFIAPNRGLLITAGNGSTITPGVWAYDGAGWKELATVCGATDGRIAWAGQNEFWTVSDGRAGQTHATETTERVPLADNTLCRFAGGHVVASYASLAFQANSYQAMHGAGCLAADDCWFAGEPLPGELPITGSFHLHWNGSSLAEEPYEGEAQPVEDMRAFDGRLYESVRVTSAARTEEEPPVLHVINPSGVTPTFEGIAGGRGELESPLDIPLYGAGEFVEALRALHISADENDLWVATSQVPKQEVPEGSAPGQVTIVRYSQQEGVWKQLIGPATTPSGQQAFPGEVVEAIAAEPGGEGAWVALDSPSDAANPSPGALAMIAYVASDGAISQVQTLPSQSEREHGISPAGAASRIVCPATHDCWLATTQGWLFHLRTGDESLPVDDEGFSNLITSRPADQGLPQLPPDIPPEEEALPAELPAGAFNETVSNTQIEASLQVPLLSDVHSRIVHGSTLRLRFHLAVKARVRLLAKRHQVTVASTPTHTFAAGNRELVLRLNRRRWPTKLALQTHALAPLPTVSSPGPSIGTVTTSLVSPNQLGLETGSLFGLETGSLF